MNNKELAKTILNQIKAIRDTGKTNMLMDCTVKDIAEEMGFIELVKYMTENPDGYFGTILRGEVKFWKHQDKKKYEPKGSLIIYHKILGA